MSQKKTRTKSLELRVARIMDYKRVFSSEQGKRVLHDLMHSHYVMRNTFDRKLSSDEHFFREGQRAVVLRILSAVDKNENDMKRLMMEASNDPAYK